MNDKPEENQKPVMSKVMTVFPELKIIPKIKENGSISVDVVTNGRLLITHPEIEGLNDTKEEMYCAFLNSIAMALGSVAVYPGTSIMKTVAELTARLGMIELSAAEPPKEKDIDSSKDN